MKNLLLASAITLILAACGGGSSSGNSTNNGNSSGGGSESSPSSPVSTVVIGNIDSISDGGQRIRIGDKDYDVGSVRYQGQPQDPSMLISGMRVRVDGDQSGVNVELLPSYSGEVTAINGDNFIVNGKSYFFAGFSGLGIEIGDWVLITIKIDSSGKEIVVSVAKAKPGSSGGNTEPSVYLAQVSGRIASIDQNTQTLVIEDIIVDFSNARLNPQGLVLQVGIWVAAHGSYVGDRFVAKEIDLERQDYSDVSGTFDISGRVTDVKDLSGNPTFTLDYKSTFITNNNTCYREEGIAQCNGALKTKLRFGTDVAVRAEREGDTNVAIMVQFNKENIPPTGNPDGNDAGDSFVPGGSSPEEETSSTQQFECKGVPTNINTTEKSFLMPSCRIDVESGSGQELTDRKVYWSSATIWNEVRPVSLAISNILVRGFRRDDKNIAIEISENN